MTDDVKLLLALTALILFLMVAASVGFTFDRSDWNEEEQERDIAHQREEPVEDHQALRPAGQASDVQNHAAENQPNRNQANLQDRQLRVAIGLNIATLAIAIPTTLGLIILYGTLNATKFVAQATKTQGDVAIAASRAWMVPTDQKAKGLAIVLNFVNAGNSPAVDVHGSTEYALASNGFVPTPHFAPDCAHLKSKQPAPDTISSPVVLSKDSFAMDPIQGVPSDWYTEVKGDLQPIFPLKIGPGVPFSVVPTVRTLLIHGCVWYTDVLSNQERSTEFYFTAARDRPKGSTEDTVSIFAQNPFDGLKTPYFFY